VPRSTLRKAARRIEGVAGVGTEVARILWAPDRDLLSPTRRPRSSVPRAVRRSH
jgi:hypothetical protein